MPLYELVFIGRQEMASTEVDRLTDELTNIVKEFNGTIIKHEYWGLRQLAYEINRNQKGHYVLLALSIDGSAIQKIKNKIKHNAEIIRYRFIRVTEISPDPSPILKGSSFNQQEDAVDVTN